MHAGVAILVYIFGSDHEMMLILYIISDADIVCY